MISKYFTKKTSKYNKFFIIFIWLFTTLLYLQLFGIVTKLEAGKYIEEAGYVIKNGSFSATRFWFYSITLFILIIALKLKIGMTGAFILQAILNLYAYLLFYNALKKVFQNTTTAFYTIIYLLVFWPYQNWVVFLYTESAFFSLILILTSIVILYKPNNIKGILLIGLGLLLVTISRPLGILFSGSIYIYLFYCAGRKWKIILSVCSIIVLVTAYHVTNIIFSTISDWRITQSFEQESIICNLPTNTPSYTKLYLATSGTPVYHLFYYLVHNFSHFLHFAGIKIQYFFLMARPYYSKSHNYFLLFNTIGMYILMVGSFFIKQIKFDKGVTLFLISSIVLYAITIIFQCDDYHNRFILSIYPFFVVLAARMVEFLVLFFFKNNKQTTGISIEKPVS